MGLKKIFLINPILFIIISVFIVLNIIDLISTIYILPGESNPIYLLTGSFIWVILLKIGVVIFLGIMYYRNQYKTHFTYYLMVLILVLGSLLIGFAAINNISVAIFQPEYIKIASDLSTTEKVTGYGILILFLYLIPAVLNIATFIIYDKTFKKVKFKKKVKNK